MWKSQQFISTPRRRGDNNVLRPKRQLSPAGQVQHSASIWKLRRVLAHEILSGGGSKVTRQIGRGWCDDTLLGLALENESFLCEASRTSAGLRRGKRVAVQFFSGTVP